jgi:hypothetical protein
MGDRDWIRELDLRVGPHREAGDGVARATVKAIKEMRRDRQQKGQN